MTKELISIIVPIYNTEKYLECCVTSLINQTYKNLEIILVDDGSPDASPALCDKFAKSDKRIKVIHKENGGVSSARNTGLENAKGKYICFVDSDDWVELSFVEDLINDIKTTNSDISFCLFDIVKDNGQVLKINERNIDTLKNLDITSFFLTARNGTEREDTMGSACRIMADTKLLKDLKFNTSLHFAEDLIFILQILEKEPKVSVIHKYLYHYYSNVNSTVKANPKYLKNLDNTYNYLKNYLKDKKPELLPYLIDDYIFITLAYFLKNKHSFKNIKNLLKTNQEYSKFLNRKNGKKIIKYHKSKVRKIFTFFVYRKCFVVPKLMFVVKKLLKK